MGESEEPRSRASARPLVIARVFCAAITFLIPLTLARLLDLEEYGTFKQFFLLSHTVYFALAMGIPQSLYYFLPRAQRQDRRAWLGQTQSYLLAAGIFSTAALYAATPLMQWVGGEQLLAMRLPLALYCGLLLGGGALEPGLTAQGKTTRAALTYVGSDSLKMASYVLPALLGYGLSGVLWGAASYALLRTLTSWVVLVAPHPGPIMRRDFVMRQIKYALPFGGAMLLAMPQQQLHQYVVSVTSSPAVFAIYSVGCFNLPVVDLLYTPTTELLMYQIGEEERRGGRAEAAAALFRDAVSKLSYAFLPIAAGLFVIAPQFLTLLYTEKFIAATPIMRVALGIVVLACLPVEGVLRAKDRTRSLFWIYVGKVVVSVPLILSLASWLGPIGAMIGFVLTEAATKLVLLAASAHALLGGGPAKGALRRTLQGLPAVLPGKAILRAGAAALVAGLAAFATQWAFPMEPLSSFVAIGTFFWVVYAVGLVAVGVRPLAVLQQLR